MSKAIQPRLIFEKESLEENLNPLYYKQSIDKVEFQTFKNSVLEYLTQIYNHKDAKSESWLVSNALLPFLENVGFKGCVEAQYHQSKQNQNSTIDLVLTNENVEVIFEAKKPDNRSEMFSAQNTTAKAMREAILYYIRERENGNVDLKFIILTDFFNFYIFKAIEFEKLFYKNPCIKKIYENKNKKGSVISNNQDFYEEIEKALFSDAFFQGICATNLFDRFLYGLHIDLRLFESDCEKYKNIFKVFHKNYLFAEYRPDSNRINQKFFDELLFVLGLKQDSKTNKIEIDTEQNISFIKIIQAKLTKKPSDSLELFDKSMELLIVWLNRILFLKLIETNLSHFNSKNGFQAFLTKEKIKDFKTLEHLFFEVLAKHYKERQRDKGFNYLPYLNSSLFLRKKLESHFSIKDLDNFDIVPYRNTQVRDINTHKKITDKLPFLAYLFDFLNAFDFDKDFEKRVKTKQDKQTQQKTQEKDEITDSDNAMDSRILGLVFEELNGFKEGSFYTPGFITEYMCKEALEKIILEKFNKLFSANVQDLENAREYLKLELKSGNTQARDKLKEALLSIRVCDPSVGSGHFLASALNYLCYYFDYFTLSGLKDVSLKIENDTLKQGFHYKRPKSEEEQNHKNQKALFTLKRQIIESCLFGVDINPISCKIARLRLWIELLKNSYYIFENGKLDSNIHKLETLPNIDINIKCGNALTSYLPIFDPLLINIKEKIKEYQRLESDYFNCRYTNRDDHIEKIKKAKKDILQIHLATKFKEELLQLSEKCDEYSKNYEKYGIDELSEHYEFLKNNVRINGLFPRTNEVDKEKAQQALENLKKEHNKIFKTFEWRIEFSKLLDTGLTQEQIVSNNKNKQKGNFKNLHKNNQSDFLGFDLVIGNPPYIRQEEIKHLKPQLQKAFRIYKGTSDIYTYFYEQGHKILKHNGILSFITSNKYCRAGYGEPLREFLLKNTSLLYYIELNGIKVFDSASVDTSILSFIKAKNQDSKHTFYYAHPKDYDTKSKAPLQRHITPKRLLQSSLSAESFIFQDTATAALKAKIEAIGTPLKRWDISIYRGILTGYNEAFIIDSNKRDEILRNCDDTQASLKPFLSLRSDKVGVAIHKHNDKGEIMLTERERTEQLIKPILRGRDIKRYSYEWAQLWIINTHNGYTTSDSSFTQSLQELQQPTNLTQDTRIAKNTESKKVKIPPIDINDYPALKAHLDTHWDKIAKRADKGITPYNLRNCAYLEEFAKEKIVYSEIVKEPQFHLDSGEFKFGNFYAEATSFILSGNENLTHSLHYLLGILHSKLITYAFKKFYAGGGLGESGYRYKKAFLERLPIPKVDSKTEAEFIQIVQEILESKKQGKNTKELESKLDTMVFKLYHLSDDEIKLIECGGGGNHSSIAYSKH
ncbi:Eco57I restriction-modification methylase domain-containing protein [Helicobacter sp.]|uniref:type IIG restriction enzyme/methyltransferase n=1 Tax=Helicobacter sp. TaxID=218 RepID=UPI0025C655D7|nr:Eco57I restriction-modification methylase domain-containing protein [Helicobacter sp.]MCI5968857.1 Eco57I restriction-modification methylase domain-containing protein [Helicobacter sp.]